MAPDLSDVCRRGAPTLAVWALASLLLGCGVSVERPQMGYYFSHPLLNERWTSSHFQRARKPRQLKTAVKSDRKKTTKRTKVAAKSRKQGKAAAKAPARPVVQALPGQDLRGNDTKVLRGEMVLSAQRLLGIEESFSQDSFLRHLLLVNNLGLGKMPREGTVGWLYKAAGSKKDQVAQLHPGDLLFLGESGPERCVVVEKVEEDGTVHFIGYLADRVTRGVLSLTRRQARRDEKSQKVLNSFVGKSQPAGALLLGAFSLAAHQKQLAGDAAATP